MMKQLFVHVEIDRLADPGAQFQRHTDTRNAVEGALRETPHTIREVVVIRKEGPQLGHVVYQIDTADEANAKTIVAEAIEAIEGVRLPGQTIYGADGVTEVSIPEEWKASAPRLDSRLEPPTGA